MTETSPFIVSADWLQKHLDMPGLSIVDASWYLPLAGRDAKAEYDAAHIPHAVFFDHDEVCDKTSGLPHTLLEPTAFSQYASAMGLTVDDTIVVYDGVGFFSAPRVWWMLRTFGAKKVYILDGGFDLWKAEGYPVTNEPTQIAPSSFNVNFKTSDVVFLDEMRHLVAGGKVQIADARGHGRFTGQEAQPRPNMRSGHMPHAHNVPVSSLSENGHFKSLAQLKQIFETANVKFNEPVVTTCGSGVTAAVVLLALASLGNENVRLYDGSWSEWGSLKDTDIVTGEK